MPEDSGAKSRLGEALFRYDARRRLRRAFSRGLVRGLSALRAQLERGPLIVALNHVAFWDGFVLSCLGGAAAADAYCLMDRANLERLSFLRFAGAVPVDASDARRARRDLEQAARLLDRPGRLLFVFPQGTQVPAHLPLAFRTGVLALADCAGVPIVPAGLRYEFLQDPKPEVLVSIGMAIEGGGLRSDRRRRLEQAVRGELDEIDRLLLSVASSRECAPAVAAGFVPFLHEAPQGLPVGSRLLGALGTRRPA